MGVPLRAPLLAAHSTAGGSSENTVRDGGLPGAGNDANTIADRIPDLGNIVSNDARENPVHASHANDLTASFQVADAGVTVAGPSSSKGQLDDGSALGAKAKRVKSNDGSPSIESATHAVEDPAPPAPSASYGKALQWESATQPSS